MNIICIVQLKKDSPTKSLQEYCDLLSREGEPLLPFANSAYREWKSQDNRTLLASWSKDMPPFKYTDFFHEDPRSHEVTSYVGWLLPINQATFSLRSEFYKDYFSSNSEKWQEDLVGEYLYIKFDYGGNGICTRNRSGTVPLYFAENVECTVVSNRACLAALIGNNSTQFEIDPIFQAWMLGVGWPLSQETLFRNVRMLPQGTTIIYNRDKISLQVPDSDIWYKEELYSAFRRDRKNYWDNIFDILVASLGILNKLDSSTELVFQLSGGKDSRLLLGLFLKAGLLERITWARTHGSPFNADILVASKIAKHFRLKHVIPDTALSNIDYSKKMPHHVFATEATISPFNLTWNLSPENRVEISGQEGGLREIAVSSIKGDSESVRRWFMSHYRSYDFMKILHPVIVEETTSLFNDWLEKAIYETDDPENLPTRHRLETRYHRWVGSVQSAFSSSRYFPHCLATDHPILTTYNTSAGIRRSELFHFEMMSRADNWLTNLCPFAKEGWSPLLEGEIEKRVVNYLPAIPNYETKKIAELGSMSVFKALGGRMFSWLLEDPSSGIFNFVDYGKLKASSEREISTRETQCLWNLLQLKYILSIREFKETSPRFDGNSTNPIPPLQIFGKKVLTDSEYSNRSLCNHYLHQALILERYKEAIIEVLGNIEHREKPALHDGKNQGRNIAYQAYNKGIRVIKRIGSALRKSLQRY